MKEILKVLGESANLGSMWHLFSFFEDRLWMVVGLSLTELAKRSIKCMHILYTRRIEASGHAIDSEELGPVAPVAMTFRTWGLPVVFFQATLGTSVWKPEKT